MRVWLGVCGLVVGLGAFIYADTIPATGGNVEGEAGYECTGDGDCHLLVWAPDEKQLYEMWRANIVGDQFDGGCLAAWDTSRNYGPTGRGEQCTSADAAGFPIAPLLFTADEVAAGEIADLAEFAKPGPQRVLTASFVTALLTDGLPGFKVHHHGVLIKHAVITGKLDLECAKVPHNVILENCTFSGDLNFHDSRFEYNLDLMGSVIQGDAYWIGIKVEKNLYLQRAVFNHGFNISGGLSFFKLPLIIFSILTSSDQTTFNKISKETFSITSFIPTPNLRPIKSIAAAYGSFAPINPNNTSRLNPIFFNFANSCASSFAFLIDFP